MSLVPISVCWNITNMCNLSCGFCYKGLSSEMMSENVWQLVVDKLAGSGVKRLVLSGGEPLLVKNINAILFAARNAGLLTSVITNGTLLDHDLSSQLTRSLDEITISLHSIEESAGARTSSRDFINGLRNYGIFKNRHVRKRVNTVITRQNSRYINKIAEAVSLFDVDEWHLMQFFPLHAATEVADRFYIDEDDFEHTCVEIQENWPLINVVVSNNSSMSGSYYSISPDGVVYTSRPGLIAKLGHILVDEIGVMTKNANFNYERHINQYKIVEELRAKREGQIVR